MWRLTEYETNSLSLLSTESRTSSMGGRGMYLDGRSMNQRGRHLYIYVLWIQKRVELCMSMLPFSDWRGGFFFLFFFSFQNTRGIFFRWAWAAYALYHHTPPPPPPRTVILPAKQSFFFFTQIPVQLPKRSEKEPQFSSADRAICKHPPQEAEGGKKKRPPNCPFSFLLPFPLLYRPIIQVSSPRTAALPKAQSCQLALNGHGWSSLPSCRLLRNSPRCSDILERKRKKKKLVNVNHWPGMVNHCAILMGVGFYLLILGTYGFFFPPPRRLATCSYNNNNNSNERYM